jgi:hypothetical protein
VHGYDGNIPITKRMEVMEAFLQSTAGLAVKGALVAAFLDFAFGVFAALRDGTFAIDAVAAFLRKHLIGRVLPVSLLAGAGYLTGDQVMIAAAAASLTAYAAETLGSIYGSIRPPAASEVQETEVATEVNPIPQD